jgi:endogenous inhibitor of DNA gyrase (YacG/DUF329 family)
VIGAADGLLSHDWGEVHSDEFASARRQPIAANQSLWSQRSSTVPWCSRRSRACPRPLLQGNRADRRCPIIRTVSNPRTGGWPRDAAPFVAYLQRRWTGGSALNRLIKLINRYRQQRNRSAAVTQCQRCNFLDLGLFLPNSPGVAQQRANVRPQGLGRQPEGDGFSGHRQPEPGKVGGSPQPPPQRVLDAMDLQRLNSQQVDAVFG